MRYPRITTIREGAPGWPSGLSWWHGVVGVQFAETEPMRRFCGRTWCDGRCGLPALILIEGNYVRKAADDAVRCGRVFQALRVIWTGETIEVPAEYRDTVREAMWW